MELRFDEIYIPRVAGYRTAQALIEGEIPFPDGVAGGRLLTAQGSVKLEPGQDVQAGLVSVSGTVKVELACAGENGEVFCFSSSAEFCHNIPLPQAQPGMAAWASASLSSLELSGNGPFALSAVVDLECRLMDEEPLSVLCGIAGCSDMEFKTRQVELPMAVCHTETYQVRHELSAPDISTVLGAKACVLGGDRPTLGMELLCRDKGGSLVQLCPRFPLEQGGPGTHISVHAVSARCSEEYGLVACQAQLEVASWQLAPACAQAPECAFSPTLPFSCKTQPVQFCGMAGTLAEERTLRESVALPEDAKLLESCSAKPLITAQGISGGRLYLEGILLTQFIYQDEAGLHHGFSEDIPFSCDFAAEGDIAELELCCLAEAHGAARAEVCYTLGVFARLLALVDAEPVVGAEPAEPTFTPHGLYLYYASAGETAFDVARRFGIPTARLCGCQDTQQALAEGQRLTILI